MDENPHNTQILLGREHLNCTNRGAVHALLPRPARASPQRARTSICNAAGAHRRAWLVPGAAGVRTAYNRSEAALVQSRSQEQPIPRAHTPARSLKSSSPACGVNCLRFSASQRRCFTALDGRVITARLPLRPAKCKAGRPGWTACGPAVEKVTTALEQPGPRQAWAWELPAFSTGPEWRVGWCLPCAA